MNRPVVLFINGILTRPGDAFAWTDDAVRWFNRNAAGAFAPDKFEYYSPALLRRVRLAAHADDLARTIADYAVGPGAPEIHLVGHSNGCELIARAVQLTGARIASIHLFAGAVERDFTRNGLADRIARGQVGRAWCYCSRGDMVLRHFARPSQFFGFLGLGYGDLGARGPVVPGEIATRVGTWWGPRDYGHSAWFELENFDHTMRLLLHNLANTFTTSP